MFEKDMKLVELKQGHRCLRNDLIAQYGQLKKARDTVEGHQYRRLGLQIRSRRKKLQKGVFNKAYRDFFGNVGNDIIEKNYHGQDTSFVPNTSLVLPERMRAQSLIRSYSRIVFDPWNFVLLSIISTYLSTWRPRSSPQSWHGISPSQPAFQPRARQVCSALTV
ncbi:hypothetical protein ACJ73_01926 [Blastomyces percursus]|uniref:Uncharacterized protein n=1 Tax=Blastomyces percursus TaxID=1658174 RepID=A0A1J9RDN5_9EURO|nr:hypothetical protein ACJ73_01926 [Blastomyces percursus]